MKYDNHVKYFLDDINQGLLTYENVDPNFNIQDDLIIWGGSFHFLSSSKLYPRFAERDLVDSHRVDIHKQNATQNNTLRTDYLFSSKSIKCVFSGTFKVSGSQHRGVVVGYNF